MPNIFYLVKIGFKHGMPSLFSSKDPSRPLHRQYVEHVGGLENPVHSDVRRYKRLDDGKDTQSRERLVSQEIAARIADIMPQDIPLDDIQLRTNVNIQIDPPRELYAKNKTGIF